MGFFCSEVVESKAPVTLPKEILSKKIERITIDGVYHAFEALGDHAIILIPSFDQESQILQIYC